MRPSILRLLCALGLNQADREKIFNRTDCKLNSQPWHVGLYENIINLYCSSVLVDSKWVLTAAHCSGWYLNQLDQVEQMRYITLSGAHPSYQGAGWSHEHDLRLLRLALPVRLTHSIRPLPGSRAAEGTQCQVSSWVTTNQSSKFFLNQRQCLNLSIISNDMCQAVFPGRVTENMVCAVNDAERDACQGVCGGPLVCGGVLRGLMTWGSGVLVHKKAFLTFYTSICKYADWIRMVIANN